MSSLDPRPLIVGNRTGTIQCATERDAADVLELMRASASESDFLARHADELRITLDQEAEFLREQQVSERHLFLVAELEGRIVGCAHLSGSSLRRFAHTAVLGISVLRDFWSQGIGRALLQATLDWADARGLVRISLEVAEMNVNATRLYESCGFVHEGCMRLHRKHGDEYRDSLLMARIRPDAA